MSALSRLAAVAPGGKLAAFGSVATLPFEMPFGGVPGCPVPALPEAAAAMACPIKSCGLGAPRKSTTAWMRTLVSRLPERT